MKIWDSKESSFCGFNACGQEQGISVRIQKALGPGPYQVNMKSVSSSTRLEACSHRGGIPCWWEDGVKEISKEFLSLGS
jgi:hypothetical protein